MISRIVWVAIFATLTLGVTGKLLSEGARKVTEDTSCSERQERHSRP